MQCVFFLNSCLNLSHAWSDIKLCGVSYITLCVLFWREHRVVNEWYFVLGARELRTISSHRFQSVGHRHTKSCIIQRCLMCNLNSCLFMSFILIIFLRCFAVHGTVWEISKHGGKSDDKTGLTKVSSLRFVVKCTDTGSQPGKPQLERLSDLPGQCGSACITRTMNLCLP
jgi:hypothetical protein